MSYSDIPAPNDMDAIVGNKMRNLRVARRLSLKGLADRSGLSDGHLSQLERGLSSASFRTLRVIAEVLAVPIGALFPDVERAASYPDGPVLRSNERANIVLWRSGITKEILTPANTDTDLVITMYELVAQRGGTSGAQTLTHGGDEAGFVLEGELVLEIDGASYTLGPGDGFCFSSARPHRFTNASAKPARVIWVNCAARPAPSKAGG